jgi:ATP phosphoribosyltransferase regulatory subunit
MAVSGLTEIGAQGLTVDLNLPPLVAALAERLQLDADVTQRLRQALDRKDAAAVEQLAGDHAPLFQGLLRAAGPARDALDDLAALDLPERVQREADRLQRVVALVQAALPDLTLTVDPVEHRGFEYHQGVTFTIYARGVRGELGRGGRYTTDAAGAPGEPATGFTLFMDSVLRALPEPADARRVYVPHAHAGAAARVRAEGWPALAGLAPEDDPAAEARRLGCTHLLKNGDVQPLDGA